LLKYYGTFHSCHKSYSIFHALVCQYKSHPAKSWWCQSTRLLEKVFKMYKVNQKPKRQVLLLLCWKNEGNLYGMCCRVIKKYRFPHIWLNFAHLFKLKPEFQIRILKLNIRNFESASWSFPKLCIMKVFLNFCLF